MNSIQQLYQKLHKILLQSKHCIVLKNDIKSAKNINLRRENYDFNNKVITGWAVKTETNKSFTESASSNCGVKL